jgi:hypothetical protein
MCTELDRPFTYLPSSNQVLTLGNQQLFCSSSAGGVPHVVGNSAFRWGRYFPALAGISHRISGDAIVRLNTNKKTMERSLHSSSAVFGTLADFLHRC